MIFGKSYYDRKNILIEFDVFGVYNLMVSRFCDYYANKIVIYLESNVSKVTGNWPDEKLFIISNQSRTLERLARLEEKWLGMNR
jgi:hypothetical protein